MRKSILGYSLLTLALTACEPGCTTKTQEPANPPSAAGAEAKAPAPKVGPSVDQNYAYDLVLKYEKFGPKVPGTPAWQKAGDWMLGELKGLGLTVYEQKGTAVTFDKHTIPVRNFIAQINPAATNRYLLSAHWDNRPFADHDPLPKNRKKPVPGVNDGGSGVAVLMAIAKAAKDANPGFGIDFLFWDAEDWGNPQGPEETYCLGTQLWAKNPVPANYKAKWGINFDMVGRIGSVFPIESISLKNAPEVVEGLRAAARALGYQDYFPYFDVGSVTDDHVFVTQGTGIPVVDVIAMDPYGRFPPEWHTIDDTSKVISRDVLKAVAQTTVQLLWMQK